MSRRPDHPPAPPRPGRGGRRVPPRPPGAKRAPPRPPTTNRASRGRGQMTAVKVPPSPPRAPGGGGGGGGGGPVAQVATAPAIPDRTKRTQVNTEYLADIERRIAAWYAYQAWYAQQQAYYAQQQAYYRQQQQQQQYYAAQQQQYYGSGGGYYEQGGYYEEGYQPAASEETLEEESLDEEPPTPATPVATTEDDGTASLASPLVVTAVERIAPDGSKIPPPRPAAKTRKPLRRAIRKAVVGVHVAKVLSAKVKRVSKGPPRFDPLVYAEMFSNPNWFRVFEFLPIQDLYLRVGLCSRKLFNLVFSCDMYKRLCLRRIEASSKSSKAKGPVGVGRRAPPRIHSMIREMADSPNVSLDRWKEVFMQLCLCFRGSTLMSLSQMTTLNLLSKQPEAEWRLLYLASRDGWGAADFHKKCDFKDKTMVVIKSSNGCVFGGYTPLKWNKNETFQGDDRSFLFSLVTPRKEDRPTRMDCTGPFFNSYNSIWCAEGYGPCFGELDIVMYDRPNERADNYTHLGYSYSLDGYELGTQEIKEYLTGAYNFTVAEIEVFQRV